MVAGMLMPRDQLRAIYEMLFREGVMVAKKDRRPRSLHPHVPGVTNLQVMRAMASLRARGLVRETFAWCHFYWYLTNEGIAHLRQYLHLPPEIVPASLQRVRRPVAMVMPARRTPHVQAVQGPLGSPPKRGPLPAEEQRVYRRKELEEVSPETPVVPATTQRTLARPGPEPAPATDERDRVQKKTFTKWVNKHLIKAQRHISDLYEDLRDGHNLISLLEVLSGDSLPREKGRMRFHKLQNVQIALDYLRHRQVKLVNIRNDDIADGNPKLTLGLIWTIILHFQISDIQVSGQSEDMTAKEKLLLWSQRMVEGYQGLRCDNFTSSWRDGRLFNAIIHRHKPMLIDMNKVYRQTNLENLDQAFSVAERDLGVTRLLDPEDVDVPQPDEKSIITYVSSLYDAMPRVPDVQDGVRANELQLRWQEYRELVLLLLQWMRHHTAAFEERRFPSSFEEIEILWSQFLKFKEMELPAKEADKNRSKGIYQSLEGAVQAGQLKVPPGYHPLDVEKEWGKLHVAILEREKQLRSEFERLECLQRIVTKLQMEAGLCEEQLNQADALLQSDVRLLAAGKVPQRAGEVERDLDKADSMIRLLFNDVQTLKDGRHPQGEQMYRRVYRLHERLVAIRTEYNLRLKAGVAAPATQVTQVTLQSVQRRPELEDSTLRYLQDLLAWVEENQHRVDGAEWGVDLPSVEAQLGSHRGLHQSIEEFRAKIERARSDEGQLSPATRGAYRDCLGRLDLQYAKLLNSSKARLRSLESLHSFVAAATKELMWLNEKEEEEVGFDWSDRNTNMTAKKESYSALMRELELKEKKIKELQNAGDRLLREDHPARPTVESFQAALQTQWSWMLQLCCCIEAHLKENAAYFQFFSDVREAEGQVQKLQEALRRKYSCDRSATVTRLEDLLQDAQDEKEQLNEYKGHLSGLAKRAKAIVQLKPRHPAHPMRGRLPLLAVCDYKQVEVTVHKGDECQLVGPAQPSHWKVLSSSGSEAAVPSVCFLVPPPNQEAQEAVTRLEAQHQALVTLWHQLHVDMKSLLAWQSLRRDVQLIRSWSLATFRTLKPEEQRQALHSLELHYQAFLRDSQDAGGFGPEDRLMAEREYGSCSHHYQQLLQSLEQGAQEESRCQRCISELKDIRLQLEACETRTVHRLRLPLDKEPARECAQRITEQQKAQAEVEGLGKGVARLSAEAEKVLALPEPSPAAPTLRSELELTLGKLEQVRSLSAIYLEKLKTISLVIRSTQGAEEVLRAHEEQLKEAQAVPATLPELEATKASLKKLRAQAEAQQPMFDALRDELRGAQEVGERLQQRHGERDVEVERWRERVAQLLERWQAVLAQTDVRQRELEQLGRQLRYYRESADPLGAWLQDARRRQEQIQAMPLADSQAVREQLRQEQALLEEIERHGEKVEECQRFAKQYINAIKDYELQLVTYKAQLEPVASPAKKPKVQSGSESVIQEYVDLRTRYSELTTLTSQYIKFISETLRRMEEEERLAEQQRAEERERLAEVEAALEKQRQLAEAHAQAKAQAEREAKELQQRMQEEAVRREEAAVDAQQQKRSIQEELQQLRQSSEAEIQAKARQAEAAERSRLRIEEEIRVVRLQLEATERQRGGAEGELQALRARAEEAEAQKRQAQEEAERLRRQVQDESQRKRQAEAELASRVKAEAEAAREKQRALQALEELRLQLAKVRAEMEVLLASKARAEEESRSTSEKSKQRLEAEAGRFRELAEEAARLRALAEEAKRQRQLAEEDAARQRAEAERVLAEKLAAISEATRLKTEAEIALKEKEAENERLRRLAEDEAFQRRRLEEQAAQHKADIEERLAQLRKASDSELERQKGLVEDTLRQRRQVEEEILALKASFEKAAAGKAELELELGRIRSNAQDTLRSKEQAELEAARQRQLAAEEERRRREAEERVQKSLAAEEEAARQRKAALEEVERLKAKVEEARRLRERAEQESARQLQLAQEAAQKRLQAEEKAHAFVVQQKEQELQQTLQQEQSVLDRLRSEAEAARRAAEEAEEARVQAEREAAQSRQQVEEAERLKQSAEEQAQAQAQAQAAAEKLRKEAEQEAARRAQAEQAALRQKQAADAEMEKHKKFAEQTLRQKAQVEQELTTLRLQLEETDHQKNLLDEELQRLKAEATEAARQRSQVEEELFSVRVQMEELSKLKARIEAENRTLILRDKDNTQRFLQEEAEKMKQVAEEAARLSVAAQEAARLRQLAEEDLAQQRALAEKMLKEKMQAVQEATRLKAEAELLQQQKELAQEQARRLQEDKEQMAQQLAEETQGFQRTLEAERQRQLEMSAEAERLKLRVAEMSRAQARAEEDAQRFRKQAEEIGEKLHRTELATQEKVTLVQTLEIQRQQSDHDAERLREAIAELEREKEKLQQEAKLLQLKSEEMQTVQQEQLLQETQALQQSFLSEKDSLLQRERFIEQEKAKLEQLFQDEVAKAQQLREEQQRQQQQMEQERQRLVASMEEARRRQHEAEEGVRRKQEELQQLEQQRRQQEELLAEENQRLREQLQRLEEQHRAALAHSEEVTASQVAATKTLPNGRDALDGPAAEAEPEHSFDGLRRKVPAQRLQEAGILSAEELQRLAQGHTTVDELARREDVRHYLQGRSSIAGLLLKPTNEKLSVYAALQRQLLSPGTALILLEAQAASGFLLDPVRNRRLTVNEAVKEGVVGPELHHKLLSRAVTGYTDPYTGQQISLFQAMQKDLIVREHGIRLLEAQIATGGVVDPVHSHRVPVDVAYRRGYFNEEMNRVLADPSDDTKGFFDPNTQENLTYLQLLERCVEDPETGLRLLPLTDKAAKGGELVYTDSEARDVFEKATVSAPFGKFQGKTVTIWEIINSEYFTAEQRRDLLRQFRTGRITVEKIIKIIITVVEEQEQKGRLCFEGLRSLVPAAELLESGVIDRELYQQLQRGERSVREVAEVDTVRRALRGANVIAGVWLEEAGQKLSIYNALKKDLLPSDMAVALLEAQAGTGHIIDPATSARLTVDEAVRAGLVGPEFHEKLLSAEKAVTGYRDPYTGQSVSLFQALKKGLIPREQGLRLLDAQLSTGGVVDPSKSHRVPLDVACARGCLDEETSRALSAPRADAKAYSDPSTGEPVTYSELQQRCRPDQLTGLSLLPLSEKAARIRQEELYSELQARETFEKTPVEVPVGGFKGRTVTVWELISSEYFTAEQRQELLRQFRTGKVTVEKVIKILITIVEEVETLRQERLSFSGLRAPVPASELLASGVLSRAQFEQLKDGKTTVKDLSELGSVRTLLQGSGCLAGIYLEDTKEKVSIYEAMRRGLLRASTAALLLEAQAATGFLVDPVRNQRLYVHEAVKAGVVGPELHEQLLSAEKAVTGYRDPYSGSTISLFQAMQKGLVLRQHGIRLLEAQIATGGIIDPVHSHRVPVDVAYQRGYFNEEMNRVLADPSDDTKGFFDPNTHENLTYRQLLERCVEDPETGLRLLPLKGAEKAEVVETTQVYTEEETRRAFEETQIDIPGGGSHGGSTMSLWEVMQSDLIPEEQRAQLMADFQAGRVTKERMIIIIIEIIEKTEIIRQQGLASYDYVRRRLTAEDLFEARIISLETYNLLREGSRSLREALEAESAWRYLYGTGSVAGVYLPGSRQTLSIYQALKKGLLSAEVARLLLEAQAATGFLLDPVKGERLTVDEAVRKGLVGPELHDRLLSAERAVTGYRDPYTEQTISLFQAMKKELIPTEEALRLLDAQLATGGIVDPRLGFHLPLEVAYQRGYLNKDTHDQLSEPSEVRSYVDPSTDERLSYTQLLRRCRRDDGTGQLLLPLSDARKLTFRGLRKQITVEELVRSQVMDEATALQLREGLTSIEEVTKNLQKFLEGTSCIAGVFVDATKERLSVYQAMKKGIIRPGTAFELLEAQAATGYVIDPIKGLKLTVEEAVRMGIVGPEFKDKLLSAERAVTGYKDPYSGKLISLFQAMKKGLILKDHGIRLLEAQIATGGIIDPEESHRLPVEVAYKRGLFDEEMNEILTDPSDDTKGFFDPNTEENLTYLQLMERCITDPQTGLCLLPLKEKKRERKTSSKSSVRKRRVVIVDPETGKEMSVYEAYRKGLIDHQTYLELSEQECEWEEITISSSDGVVKSMIIDRRSGRQYDIDDAIAKNLIDRSALDQYRAGTLSITEFADMLSGNAGGFRSRSSSVGSSSSYPISPAVSRTQLASWSDPTEETGPVAGILDTETLEKVSITEAMHRNLVDNITGQRLLEAQACTGGIIDPSTGERFPVTDAVNKGLVDKIMVDRINLAQKAFCGFEDPRTKTKMSAAQALKKGWLYYEAGQRFLEVQYLTGGLIEPDTPGRVPLDEALQRGTVDARTAQKLRDVGAYSKYLTCPKTKLKISYKDALDRSMVEEGTGLRLLEAAAQSTKGYYSPYSVSGSGSTAGSRTGSRTGSRAGSRRGSFDATGSGFSMTFSSSSYSSSGYGRRYASGSSASLGGPESAVA
uniref:Plectin n=1 Tax=Gorilla gorilla gorilla TaxID=9595 RepID=G3R960_GORGO